MDKLIFLQRAAPPKPPLGQPCNGCGVCCAAATCPLARLALGQWRGPCRALEWDAALACYRCGLLRQPQAYLRWLPAALGPWFGRRARRWIAAGVACDSSANVAD
ncbi:hypothetical protein [Massilia sp. TS11]|uniref:hypothetical protein n=1 Tax=Massilia sp. TS11 TaxID=2908003 RepID=UPI001EDA66D3|nr:hypothetical protein [Massilia sp. TS11]MCG2583596.1 hypothetical protein [Massilia sp. TS11]